MLIEIKKFAMNSYPHILAIYVSPITFLICIFMTQNVSVGMQYLGCVAARFCFLLCDSFPSSLLTLYFFLHPRPLSPILSSFSLPFPSLFLISSHPLLSICPTVCPSFCLSLCLVCLSISVSVSFFLSVLLSLCLKFLLSH